MKNYLLPLLAIGAGILFISKKKPPIAELPPPVIDNGPKITITQVRPEQKSVRFSMSVNGKVYNNGGRPFDAWGAGWRTAAGDGVHYFGGYSGSDGKLIHLYIGHYEYEPVVSFVEDVFKNINF